jgi:hypothetical protein
MGLDVVYVSGSKIPLKDGSSPHQRSNHT